jgi:hypothetical protein
VRTTRVGLTEAPQVGHFTANGMGDFFSDDTYRGRRVVARLPLGDYLPGIPILTRAC